MMPHRGNKPLGAVAAAVLAVTACSAAPDEQAGTAPSSKPALGLMTSLPIYWPEGAQLHDLAAGNIATPWQRRAIEAHYRIVPLDTLSLIPALFPDAPEVDPLAGIARLAVVQPRGLSPADNVALDQWVRGGGRLLLVLDPALTGDYDTPLGDPRRPVDRALIPPVVARWGLAISFDEGQELAVTTTTLAGAQLPLALAGRIAITDSSGASCAQLAAGAVVRCQVGEGQVTIIADAALFEHRELAGEDGATLRDVLAVTLE